MAKRTDKTAGGKRSGTRKRGTPGGRRRGPARPRQRGRRPEPAGPVDVTALSLAELAELLGVSLSEVKAHADEGAPVGADGRVNLVEFAAWANRRLQRARPR